MLHGFPIECNRLSPSLFSLYTARPESDHLCLQARTDIQFRDIGVPEPEFSASGVTLNAPTVLVSGSQISVVSLFGSREFEEIPGLISR